MTETYFALGQADVCAGRKSVLQTALCYVFPTRDGEGGCPNRGLGKEESGKWLYCTDLQTLHLFKNKSIQFAPSARG